MSAGRGPLGKVYAFGLPSLGQPVSCHTLAPDKAEGCVFCAHPTMGLRRNSNWDFTRPVFCRLDLESQSLHHAVERGDVDSLQRLIDTDLKQCINLVDSVNARDGLLKGTPLHAAAEEGDAKVAKFLLLNEADIFAKDRHGNEPLHLASVRGHTKLINLFIEKGAMVNNRNDAGNIALHYACNKGHNEAVDLLLRKGSVLNSKNANGWTVRSSGRGTRPGPPSFPSPAPPSPGGTCPLHAGPDRSSPFLSPLPAPALGGRVRPL